MPVKIRKGLSAKLMLEASDMTTTLSIFGDAIEALSDKIVPTDPSAVDTIERVQTIRELIVSSPWPTLSRT
jgi:hypothetical protein